MLGLIADIVSWLLIVTGALACVISGYGMLRMPDLYSRIHAASVADTGGMLLILIGLMFQAGLGLTTAKLVLIVVFLLITSPTATHALARAARQDGVRPASEKRARR
ncbi:monovalent cation/H(+) antiporter subunit G [Salinisphaera hydrothermalis]|uniref:Monovalent cation/proton antiporter subunit MnhG/PhaG n=1 Tax=Salinisphaera hydrothermalis (strain C41B8) TaxID=1304275 RepID=A0A084INU6_SALHC|nr:monovalent cation/H(+) antiporter subunit G [Salinisphaera hydrothermalis]KEZ78380.1 monovalent cation/proton antiporter subunit MnhG/PhaG [Salinisphaera hydrothermalis C41B8]